MKIRRLRKLVRKTASIERFLSEIVRWPRVYAVVTPRIWTKKDYQEFYTQTKGGN